MDPNTPLIIRFKNAVRALKKSALYSLSFAAAKLRLKKAPILDIDRHAAMQRELDKKLVYSLTKSRFPTWGQMKYLKRYLSPTEKRLMNISLFLLVLSSLYLGTRFYIEHLVIVPQAGGEYREALLGSPRTINPLYSNLNDVDNDLSKLIYSSLFTRGKNSELEKDLVKDFFVSSDNKTYEFTIRDDAKWHDGSPLTVADIVFTFNAITDPAYKSNLRGSFSGVKIEPVDDHTFRFVLASPYAAFLDLLTFGIMPVNLWSGIQPESADLAAINLKPIGSGPYKFGAIVKDSSGTIREYRLIPNAAYYKKPPYVNLSFKFYNSFEEAVNAVNNNSVDGISYLPKEYKDSLSTPKSLQYHKLSFPQITLLFLNQKNNPSLKDKAVRQALAYGINKGLIIDQILDGDADEVDGPILPNSFAYYPQVKKYGYDKGAAQSLLDGAGWKLADVTAEMASKAEKDSQSGDEKARAQAAEIAAVGEGKWRQKDGKYLHIKLSTVERGENKAVIDAIAKNWEEIGVKAEEEVLTASQMQGEVLRNRNFEALFYAQVLGADPDPYAFWHSSQAGLGYNVANYANKEVDQLLENARLNVETNVRQEKYKRFQEIITEEEPAIFMYSPHYTYVQKSDLKGFDVQNILMPKDRFANVTDWYIKVGKKIDFKKQN